MKNPLEKPNKTEKPFYICVCSQWIFGEIVTCDVTSMSVLAFVSSVHSPLTSSFLPRPSQAHFLNIQSLSRKNMQHKKKYAKNVIFWKEKFICFSNVHYSEIQKKQAHDTVRLVIVNEIK